MSCLKDLVAGMRARDVVFMSGYALYLTFGYMSFESPTVLTSLGESGALVQSLFLVAVIAARMVVYAAMIALARRAGRGFPPAVILVCAGVAATGFIVTRMAFQFAGFVPLDELVPWLVAGGLCFGAGDALINLLWARFSGTFDLRRVYLFVLMSSGLSLVVYLVVTLLPSALMLPVGAVLFFASVVFCRQCLAAREPIAEEYSAPVFKGALSALWRPVLGTAILSFMSGLMLQLSLSEAIPLGTFQSTSLITQAIVIVALLLPALLVKSQPSLGSVYRMALPLSSAGSTRSPCRSPQRAFCCCRSSGTAWAVWRTRAPSWERWWRASSCGAWWRIPCTTRSCRRRCCSRARSSARTRRRWRERWWACLTRTRWGRATSR